MLYDTTPLASLNSPTLGQVKFSQDKRDCRPCPRRRVHQAVSYSDFSGPFCFVKLAHGERLKTKTYTPEFRAEAVKLVLAQGLTLEEAASRPAIPKGTLANWVSAAKRSTDPAAPPETGNGSFRFQHSSMAAKGRIKVREQKRKASNAEPFRYAGADEK